jgi:hypothetical protein
MTGHNNDVTTIDPIPKGKIIVCQNTLSIQRKLRESQLGIQLVDLINGAVPGGPMR